MYKKTFIVNNNRQRRGLGMKKVIAIVLSFIGIIVLFSGYNKNVQAEETQENMSSKIIRFHVLANSDSEDDQALKIKVRDKVLEYIAPKLKESKSKDQSRNILISEEENVRNICLKVIRDNGYDYDVDIQLNKQNFPVKTYGNIVLPQGEYEAYRILIGNGEGQNWWCVMFPPLCFVDISKGEPAYEENEKNMKEVLDDDEYNLVDGTKKEEEVTFGFKIVEIIKSLFS